MSSLSDEVAALRKEIQSLEANRSPHVDPSHVLRHTPLDSTIARLLDHVPEPQTRQPVQIDDTRNILYENMLRAGGTTAFPVNNHPEVLGLRFDTLSHRSHAFLAPHYVILRPIETKAGASWEIWRHTLPVYVPLDDYAASLPDIEAFVARVRRHLVMVQYKHDKLDVLEDKFSAKVTRDLSCERVRIEMDGRVYDLKCSLDEIEVAEGEAAFLRNTKFREIERVLTNQRNKDNKITKKEQ